MYISSTNRTKLLFALQIFCAGFLLLVLLELLIFWIVQPGELLAARSVTSRFTTLHSLFTQISIFHLILLSDLFVQFFVSIALLQPLTLFRYLSLLQKEAREERLFYFDLTALTLLTHDNTHKSVLYDAHPNERVSILELVQQQRDLHQLLLGVPGAGKTTVLKAYQQQIIKHWWQILRGDEKIPIYLPMNEYSLFLKQQNYLANPPLSATEQIDALLTYLNERKRSQPALEKLSLYLARYLEEGRLLLFFDGLNEIDSDYLQLVCTQLTQLMRQTGGNHVVMTCREVDYRELQALKRLVQENEVERLLINPLEEAQIQDFIDGYLSSLRQPSPCTREDILGTINAHGLRVHCTNPMMLYMSIELIEKRVDQHTVPLHTRGLVMHSFIEQLVQREQKKVVVDEDHFLLFLGELACAARCASERNAIQLGLSTNRNRVKPIALYQELAEKIPFWLSDNPARLPFVVPPNSTGDLGPFHERFDTETLATFFALAIGSGLIVVTIDGKLSFRHEMIAEYFVAHYFWKARDEQTTTAYALAPMLFEDIGRWHEPITIWAGLVDAPMELAKRFAAFGKANPHTILEAVTLSLNCIGVLWTPQSGPITLPTIIEEAIAAVVPNASARKQLATNFNNCAQKGCKEVYLSLLPILTVRGVEELMYLLDGKIAADLLFSHLFEIIDDGNHQKEVQCLMNILGKYGTIVVERTANYSQPHPTYSARLRTAMIHILGKTQAPEAVAPLIVCLSDDDHWIYDSAIHALKIFKAEYTLPDLLSLLQDHNAPPPIRVRLHTAALDVLKHLFLEQHTTPLQRQRIQNSMFTALTASYHPDVQQKAREAITNLCLASPATTMMQETLQQLSTTNTYAGANIVHILIALGNQVTPDLLNLLPHTSRIERIRIIDVLNSSRDVRALPSLLSMVADTDPEIRAKVEQTLSTYKPQSIDGLIEQALQSKQQSIAQRSAELLKKMPREAVRPTITRLLPLVAGRTLLLVGVLEQAADASIIPALINVVEAARDDAELTEAALRILSQYRDVRVAHTFCTILTYTPAYPEELITWAMKELSELGKIALDDLVTILGTALEPSTLQKIKNVIRNMEPFPGAELLSFMNTASTTQRENILHIFRMKGEKGAVVLAQHLNYSDTDIQSALRQTLEAMPANIRIPALLAVLNQPALQADVTNLILKTPRDAIPYLVETLVDNERGDSAQAILLRIGAEVIPALVPALDNSKQDARRRARTLLVVQARQQPGILPKIVQLLKQTLPGRACETLTDILVHELAPVSVPALLDALGQPQLMENVAEVLKQLMQKQEQSEEIRQGLRAALHKDNYQPGAKRALISLGEQAVPIVSDLINDPDPSVAQTVQTILQEIGGPALPLIWHMYNDTTNQERRRTALAIFHAMPAATIKGQLVELVTDTRTSQMMMGLGLLLERVNGTHKAKDDEILSAIVDAMEQNSDQQAALHIIASLLLLNRQTTIHAISQALSHHSQRHERLIHTLLLLGKEAEEILLKIVQQPTTQNTVTLKADAAAILGMQKEQQTVTNYALKLSTYGYGNNTHINNAEELTIALRALGGLLAGGNWHINQLEQLGRHYTANNTEKELIDILLGKLYSPRIQALEAARMHERKAYLDQLADLNGQVAQWKTYYSQEKTKSNDLQENLAELIEKNKELLDKQTNLESRVKTLAENNTILQQRINQLQRPSPYGSNTRFP